MRLRTAKKGHNGGIFPQTAAPWPVHTWVTIILTKSHNNLNALDHSITLIGQFVILAVHVATLIVSLLVAEIWKTTSPKVFKLILRFLTTLAWDIWLTRNTMICSIRPCSLHHGTRRPQIAPTWHWLKLRLFLFWSWVRLVLSNRPSIWPIFSANSLLTVVHFSLQISTILRRSPTRGYNQASFISHWPSNTRFQVQYIVSWGGNLNSFTFFHANHRNGINWSSIQQI